MSFLKSQSNFKTVSIYIRYELDHKLCGFEEIQFAYWYLKFLFLSETKDARFVG